LPFSTSSLRQLPLCELEIPSRRGKKRDCKISSTTNRGGTMPGCF
jgi:hypothetical protein